MDRYSMIESYVENDVVFRQHIGEFLMVNKSS